MYNVNERQGKDRNSHWAVENFPPYSFQNSSNNKDKTWETFSIREVACLSLLRWGVCCSLRSSHRDLIRSWCWHTATGFFQSDQSSAGPKYHPLFPRPQQPADTMLWKVFMCHSGWRAKFTQTLCTVPTSSTFYTGTIAGSYPTVYWMGFGSTFRVEMRRDIIWAVTSK